MTIEASAQMRQMDCGIVFVGFGAKYIAEASAAAQSFRANMPHVRIALVTDGAETPAGFDTVLRVSLSQPPFLRRYWGFYHKIHGIKASPFRVSLYVDTDIRCCQPVHELIVAALRHGLVAVHAPRKVANFFIRDPSESAAHVMPEINTGVLAFNRDIIPGDFFDCWSKLYEEHVPADETRNFGDQSVFRELLSRFGINPFVLPPEYNLRVGLPAVIHGAVRLLHGRPAVGGEVVEHFVNSSRGHRIYIPNTALIVMDEAAGEWEVRRFPDASVVRRIPYLEFAKALLAI